MNNEPVAWINRKGKDGEHGYLEWDKDDKAEINTPLYTHPSEHDLGIAEAIGFEKGHKSAEDMLRQQQAEIEELKKQLAFMEGEYPEPTIMAKMMEVDLVRQQQVEIEALKEALEVKVILNEHAQQSMKEVKSLLRKAQEK